MLSMAFGFSPFLSNNINILWGYFFLVRFVVLWNYFLILAYIIMFWFASSFFYRIFYFLLQFRFSIDRLYLSACMLEGFWFHDHFKNFNTNSMRKVWYVNATASLLLQLHSIVIYLFTRLIIGFVFMFKAFFLLFKCLKKNIKKFKLKIKTVYMIPETNDMRFVLWICK